MSTNERDSHFLGFAERLYERLARNVVSSDKGLSNVEAFKQEQYQIIARAAYDLACHTLYETSYGLDRFYIPERINETVPDLTEWPEK